MGMLSKYLAYYPTHWIRGEPVFTCRKELERTQYLSGPKLRELQISKLRHVITQAREKIPYYQEAFAKQSDRLEFIDLESIAGLPLLSKKVLRARSREFIYPEYRGRLDTKSTGGSTGAPLIIHKDRTATGYLRGTMWRNYAWWGINVGDRQGRFWGDAITYRQTWMEQLKDLIGNRIRLSSSGFDEQSLENYYRRIRRFRPDYLYGYTSMLHEFAKYLDYRGLKLAVPMVVTTAEILYPPQRTLMEHVFQCRVADEYGCCEVGPIAFECPNKRLHLMSDNVYVEILKNDGAPVSPGETGSIVVTELNSFAMPLIRYQLDDWVELGEPGCPCGRTLPIINRVVGRTIDYLETPSGKRFHGMIAMTLVKHLESLQMGVDQLQIIQEDHQNIVVKIVKGKGFQVAAIALIDHILQSELGTDMRIETREVDVIPRGPAGKFKAVINKTHTPHTH